MKRLLLILAATLSLSVAAQTSAQPKKYTELYWQRASLFNALGCDSTSIVMLGNSLTHGCEWHELFDDHRFLNRGINGDIVEGIRERIDPIVEGHPAKIFLLCGVNDISHDLSADSIATAYTALVEYILEKTPQTQLYIQSMLPINNSFGRYKAVIGKEQVIRDGNLLLHRMAHQHDIPFIDLYTLFADEEGNLRRELTNDGLHLLAPGYAIWRDALMPYIYDDCCECSSCCCHE